MGLENVRGQFASTITSPCADPLPVFEMRPESDDAWEESRAGAASVGNHLVTAVARLSTPVVTGFGLAKHVYDKNPLLTPLAAAGGAVIGAGVGAAGIAYNLVAGTLLLCCCVGMVAIASINEFKAPGNRRI